MKWHRCSCRSAADRNHSSGGHRRFSGIHPHQCLASGRSSLQSRLQGKKIGNRIEEQNLDIKAHKCNRGRSRFLTSPGVVPVRVIRRKLLEPRSLHNVNPLRELHLTEGKEKLLHIATQGFSHYPWKETNVKERKTKSSFPIATN